MDKITMAAARVNAGKTQSQMSKEVGVSKNLIVDWEKGRKSPNLDQFERYCNACGCTVNDIDCKVFVLTSL